MKHVCGEADVVVSPHLIVIRSTDYVGDDGDAPCLVLDRGSGEINACAAVDKPEASLHVFGVFGIIGLRAGNNSFYYSCTTDLTRCMQNMHTYRQQNAKWNDKYIYEMADEKFYWNSFLHKPFLEYLARDWILPVIQGFVKIYNDSVTYALISRRSHRRGGMRYTRRGIDDEGDVANFVETEQIVCNKTEDKISSYVQIRGSIPVFWTQTVNGRYTPPVVIEPDTSRSSKAYARHGEYICRRYGAVTAINLIDKKGDQKRLGDAFADIVSTQPDLDIKYFWFDFHKECKKNKYENLSILAKMVSDRESVQGFWSAERVGNEYKVKSQQTGVFRINCIDNLDRTNVVQTYFGRRAIALQMKQLDITHVIESKFKESWADNADAISMLYTGTNALKNDFTRTGKRNFMGYVNDGVNSVSRYFLCNFIHGNTQDGYDLLTGVFDPKEAKSDALAIAKQRNTVDILTVVLFGFLLLLLAYTMNVDILLPMTGLIGVLIVYIAWKRPPIINHPKLVDINASTVVKQKDV